MKKELAPIGVSTYGRAGKLQGTIAALQKNTLAEKSEIFIFSDGARPGDEAKVDEVRSYLKTVSGFRKVNVIERQTNSRTENNRNGANQLLDTYGKMIFLEEDVFTAPGFLQYMNGALDFYEDDPRIGSIVAYCPQFEKLEGYQHDVFALGRFFPWGFAIWDRYNPLMTPISPEAYAEVFKNRKKRKMLERNVGQDVELMIRQEFDGRVNAGDMRMNFWHFFDEKLIIYPRKSLTRNTGLDGSGIHQLGPYRWAVDEIWDKVEDFEFVTGIEIDEDIRIANYDFFRRPNLRNDLRAASRQFLKRTGLSR